MLTLHKLLGCVCYDLWVPQYLSVITMVRSNVRTMSWYNGLGRGWRSNLLCHVGTCLPTTCSHIPDEYNLLNMCKIFYVLLTMHPGMMLVNNQLDAQFFMYVYFYYLHVLGSHVPVIRRIIISMWHLVYVTPGRWQSGMHTRQSPTQSDINQVSHWYNNSPDDGHMAARNTYRIEINIHEKLCIKLVIYKDV